MKVAVCDDESRLREQISEWIERYQPGCHIVMFATGSELLDTKEQFDIVFLDIQMEGINGIETARKLRDCQYFLREPVLVFVTGAREYVFEAFDVAAFHYLLKPLEETKFAEILNRAAREAERGMQRSPLLVKAGDRRITVDKSHILYIESMKRKAAIHTMKKTLEVYADMGELEEQLGEDFYRCHRGYLVNLAYIEEYGNDNIILTGGERIYLSRRKYGEFVKAYMHFLRRAGADPLYNRQGGGNICIPKQ